MSSPAGEFFFRVLSGHFDSLGGHFDPLSGHFDYSATVKCGGYFLCHWPFGLVSLIKVWPVSTSSFVEITMSSTVVFFTGSAYCGPILYPTSCVKIFYI